MSFYDYNGSLLDGLTKQDVFNENVTIRYAFDETSHTNYMVFRINKTKVDGIKQFPFARCIPGSASDASVRKTPYDLAMQEGWLFVSNGGTGTGIMIENSVVIDDTTPVIETGAIPLSIDASGNLGYLPVDFIGHGQEYVNSGIVSAVCGFYPIIDNYDDFDFPTDIPGTDSETWQYSQRQIIGQFGNGDYMFLVSEGRNFDNSIGLTMQDAQRICKTLGVRFAYNLDGGGSTQIVHGKRIVNSIYQGTTGRVRGTFFVFNGTNTYSIPNS